MGTKQTYRAVEDRAPILVLFLSLFLTGIGIWVANQSEGNRDKLRFVLATENIEENLQDRIEAYLGVLWSEVALFQSNDLQVDDSKFRKFRIAANWGGRIDGLSGLAFIQTVEPENREAFVKKMRKKHPSFDIRPPGDPTKPVLTITLAENTKGSAPQSLGFNPQSEPIRAHALREAARTGSARITHRVVLRSDQLEGKETPALVIYAPVYHPGAELLAKGERENLVYGFASVSFRLESLIEHMRHSSPEKQLGFRITSRDGPGKISAIADTGDFVEGQLVETRDLQVAGSLWTVTYWTLPTFFEGASDTFQVELVAIAGFILSVTLYSLAVVQKKARKARELALHHERRRARDLEELDKAKTLFFSNLNHELRTPLNGILGMSDLLYDTKLDEQQKDYLNSIASCGKVLTDLISDVLDLSKVRAAKMELRPSTVHLKQLFEQSLLVVRGPSQGKGVELILEWDNRLPEFIEIDEMRLRQILVNLLGNAVKFTQTGSVKLKSKLADDGSLQFEVQDTGVGIADEDLKLLFRPFSQVGRDCNVPDQKGTGLGLHLCKEILALMDGKIEVESIFGEGTTFRCTLPITSVESNPYETQKIPADSVNIPHCALRILVVDDNPINRRVLSMQLDKLGQSTVLAENGRQALQLVSEQEFDIVLMDCQMPEMDGLEATRRIRESHGDSPYIVALTAFTEETQREACALAGMNAFLTKPVDANKLKTLVGEHYAERLSADPVPK